MSRPDATVRAETMTRFPTRTLVLMLLTLVAFGWFWVMTHQRPTPPMRVVPVEVLDAGV